MTFTEVFGGNTIYPSGVSYRAVALSANQTLAWPVETATSGNVVAQIMDVTPSAGSLSIIMPPADEVSVGETTLFFNPGAFTFTIKDTGGNTIVAVAPGLSYQVYLINNSTPNGTWRSTQYSAGTSSATAGSLVGAGIKAISTTLNQSMSVTTLNSNYAIGDADRSEAFVWSGGAGAFTLPSSGAVGNDWFCHLRNNGTGAITLTPTGSELINGGPSLTFNPGDSAIIICDGSAFFTIGFGQSASFVFDYVSIDLSAPVTSPYTLSGANLNRIAYSFGGTLTANMQILIPATVQQYWISNQTSGAFTLTVKVAGQTGITVAQGARGIFYCNGTDIVDADTSAFAFPVTVVQGGTGATTESGARVNLGGTSVGIGVFTAITPADGRVALSAAASGANSDITSITGLTTPLTAAQGGTGIASYTIGDIVYATGATTLSKLADVATGNALISGGVGVAPSYGKIGLTTHVSGTLPVTNGGTGASTLTGYVKGTGTTAMTASATIPASDISSGAALTKTDDTNVTLTLGGSPTTALLAASSLTLGWTGTLAVSRGGTGASTLTGLVLGNGTSAFTAVTAPSGTVVGTSDTQTLTNKTVTQTINAQTGTTYTLAAADTSKLVTLSNAGTVTLTVPPNSSVTWAVGNSVDIAQLGAGQVTVAAGVGVTVRATPGLLLRTQYSGGTLIKIATDEWLLVGDLTA